jgi:hypothetical protein
LVEQPPDDRERLVEQSDADGGQAGADLFDWIAAVRDQPLQQREVVCRRSAGQSLRTQRLATQDLEAI